MNWGRVAPLLFILFLAALGLAFFLESLTYDYWASFGPGPAMLPRWLAAGLIACAVMLVVEQRRSPSGHYEVSSGGAGRLLTAGGLMVGAALVAPYVGLMPALALLVFLFVSLIDGNSWRFSLLVAVAAVGSIYLIFGVWLGVQFPEMYF